MRAFFNLNIPFSAGSFSVVFDDSFRINSLTKDPHAHSHTRFEFLYIRKGALRFCSEQTEFLCPRGSVLLTPPALRHTIFAADTGTETFSFLYEPCDIPKDDPVFDALCVKAPTLLTDMPNSCERLTHIREYLCSPTQAHMEKIRGETILLLADTAEALLPSTPITGSTAEENRAEQIQTYLAENCFSAECSCLSLAETLHLSPRQVHRLCIQYYGRPFRALLHGVRMDIAKNRMQNDDVSITALAEQMGYSSVSSFSAAYKRYFGSSPTKKK